MGTTIGIDLGGTKMLMLARDASGNLVAEQEIATGPDTTASDIESTVTSFCSALDSTRDRIAIAEPGLVSGNCRVVTSDVLPKIANWTPFENSTLGPVYVINDVRASLASAVATRPGGNILCVVAGTAIAAAFTGLNQDEAFEGADGWAGELGYLPVRDDTGVWRTLDEVAGGAAILRNLGMTGPEAARRLHSGDRKVAEQVTAAGEALGRAIASCVNLLNPRTLFTGGGTFRFPEYYDAAIHSAHAHTLPNSWESLEILQFPDARRFIADGARIASSPHLT